MSINYAKFITHSQMLVFRKHFSQHARHYFFSLIAVVKIPFKGVV